MAMVYEETPLLESIIFPEKSTCESIYFKKSFPPACYEFPQFTQKMIFDYSLYPKVKEKFDFSHYLIMEDQEALTVTPIRIEDSQKGFFSKLLCW